MEPLAPAYLADLASLLSSVGAFLGGFAATYLATLLTLGNQGRVMTASIACAAASAVAFIVSVIASISVIAHVHPQAPRSMDAFSGDGLRAAMVLAFVVGILSLFASVGLSGWTRSKGVGRITTVIAALGMLVTVMVVFRP
ncbi:hypothetical protein H8M03_05505 [Sphingomonas sabuli]|uniref:Uncharacterized protein n=1 Tax=Sphingomonas sabuli TaxID=2764186 RepID=A0A7G9L578_9SPHN|nr:hypothetical protein [Sphingomonas sabuli]QNM83777.1 hypothetical protein H8M03_05505 [Sphingomonas sabuli]